MSETIKKTSADWAEEILSPDNVVVMDPDGWDRKNYIYSWFEELITLEEFKSRVLKSTCIGYPKSMKTYADVAPAIKK